MIDSRMICLFAFPTKKQCTEERVIIYSFFYRHGLIQGVCINLRGQLTLGHLRPLLLCECVDLLIIKILKIFIRYFTKLLITLQQKIVGCSDMIMLVCIDAFDSVILLKIVLNE